MKRTSKIYAKEQQIKLIDNILCSLCSIELNADGRKYLNKMKQKFQNEIEQMKEIEQNAEKEAVKEPVRPFRFKWPQLLKSSF